MLDKNSNIIILVTMILMLLQLYRGIFRTLAHLIMPEACSKPYQFIQAFSDIFRDIQQYSVMFRHIVEN